MSTAKIERCTSCPVAALAGMDHQRRRRKTRTTARIKRYVGVTFPAQSLPPLRQLITTLPAQPADTEPLHTQVAGHMTDPHKSTIGMLKYKDRFVLKPLTKPVCQRELHFYNELHHTAEPALQAMRPLAPTFHGTRCVTVAGKQIKCLLLDDLTAGLRQPCVMDVKIGRRTWDPLATHQKIQREDSKYVNSKRDMGFCIPGFQVWNISDGKLHKYGKDYGRNLNGETVKDALKLFLNAESGLCRPLLLQLLGSLWRIVHWCRNQRKIRLYSSSILLVYDARLLRQYIQRKTDQISTNSTINSLSSRRNRPASLTICDPASDSALLSPGFSGQFTAEGPRFQRSISTSATMTLSPEISLNGVWKKSLKKLQRTHSFSNNYEADLQDLKQKYVDMLDDLVGGNTDLWTNVKMIDFAHVFPSDGDLLDTNYLEGVENLVKIFEEFLLETS